MVALVDNGGRYTFQNADGDWHLWKAPTHMASGSRVGPAYIGRYRRPSNGWLIVDDTAAVDPGNDLGLNDPRFGGLGAFGCHIARKNEAFLSGGNVNDYTWNLTDRMDAATDSGFGVSAVRWTVAPYVDAQGVGRATVETDLRDGYSNPVFTVKRDYRVYDSRVEVDVTVVCSWDGSGPPLYVKEPKLVAHSIGPVGGPAYRYLDLYDRAGALIRQVDYQALPSPTVSTEQIPDDGRCRLRFQAPTDGNQYLNVVAEGLSGATRQTWEGSAAGLDRWAQDANAQTPLEPTGPAYCKQGPGSTLSRKWEATRWASAGAGSPPMNGRPHVGVMLHAWEGGSGYPDCRNCYVPVVPGNTYQAFMCFSFDTGWVV